MEDYKSEYEINREKDRAMQAANSNEPYYHQNPDIRAVYDEELRQKNLTEKIIGVWPPPPPPATQHQTGSGTYEGHSYGPAYILLGLVSLVLLYMYFDIFLLVLSVILVLAIAALLVFSIVSLVKKKSTNSLLYNVVLFVFMAVLVFIAGFIVHQLYMWHNSKV